MPASPWEFDEPLFFQALHHYDPVAHHPPPPGYPLFIGVGQLVRAVVPSDFGSLVLISVVSSAVGFVLLALAFGRIAGYAAAGLIGAILFYFSPAMLLHATLPISEPGALLLLAAALYFGSRSSPAAFAAFAALTVGWRIQFAIFVVPMFLAALFLMKQRRERLVALGVFTLVCVAWLIPLAAAVGGLEELIAFETGQGRYLAAHDAAQSRGGWTAPMIALRFIAHPWGVKFASLPLLLVAAYGLWLVIRARVREALPMLVGGAVYIAFALLVMDPADGVRYAIPFVLVTSFFAGVGAVGAARLMSVPQSVLPVLFCAGSMVYVSSFVSQRSGTASPPVRAAQYALRTYPRHAVAIYELPLWPHATYFLRERSPMRLDDAMARFYDRPDVPMFLYADGGTRHLQGRSFSWEPSDAYSKLTRNHYRVASIVPVPPESRFRNMRGVHGSERDTSGLAWRWLGPVAQIQLPRGGARRLSIEAGLPETSPIDGNILSIAVDGSPSGDYRVERGRSSVIEIDVPAGAPVVTFTAARSFVPAAADGLSRDPRRLAAKLFGITARAVALREATPAVPSR